MIDISNKIHQTAILDKGVKIGKNCKIWHWTHISGGAIIGNSCSFGQNVFIGNNVLIGNNVKIIAELFSDDGNKKFTYKDECKIEEALKIAVKAGNDLKKQFEME